jgi:hypothetical protein
VNEIHQFDFAEIKNNVVIDDSDDNNKRIKKGTRATNLAEIDLQDVPLQYRNNGNFFSQDCYSNFFVPSQELQRFEWATMLFIGQG